MIKKVFGSLVAFSSIIYAQQIETITVSSSALKSSDRSLTLNELDSEELSVIRPQTISTLSAVMPNVNISGLGNRDNSTLTVRGVSNYLVVEPGVGMYVDDIPITSSYTYGAINLANASKVELLKGPQGTLFGRNSESGVLVVTTPQPTSTNFAKLSVGLGSYNTQNYALSFGGATLNENLTYLVNLYKNQREGYTTNTLLHQDVDSRNDSGGNIKFLYTLSPSSTLLVNLLKNSVRDGGNSYKANTKENPFTSTDPYIGYVRTSSDMASIRYQKKGSDYTFTSSLSYVKENLDKLTYSKVSVINFLGTQEIKSESLTAEAKLNKITSFGEVVFGAFYHQKANIDIKEYNTFQGVPSLNRSWNIALPDKVSALFGEMTHWLDDQVSLTTGLRFEQTIRDYDRTFTNVSGSTSTTAERTSNQVLPKVSLSYHIHENEIAYISYKKGYRPAGFNYRSIGVAAEPFKAEYTDAYELGYRYGTQKISFQTSLFYNMIRDLRLNTFDNNLASIVLNAPKVKTYGIEGDVSYRLDNDRYIFGSLGVVKTQIASFESGVNDYSGHSLIDVPAMTASLGGKQNFQDGYFVQGLVKHMGRIYYDIANNRGQDGFTTVDISCGKSFSNGTLSVYINNLFDSRYVDNMIVTPSSNYYHFGAPRVMGVNYIKRF